MEIANVFAAKKQAQAKLRNTKIWKLRYSGTTEDLQLHLGQHDLCDRQNDVSVIADVLDQMTLQTQRLRTEKVRKLFERFMHDVIECSNLMTPTEVQQQLPASPSNKD